MNDSDLRRVGKAEKALFDKICEKSVQSIPAADMRPAVRGRWETDDAGAAICTACGEYAFETSTHHLCGWFPNFCPNCGADMREVTINEN